MPAKPSWFAPRAAQVQRPWLVCFPYAGGGPSAFRDWSAPLGAAAEVIPARPPGRESRMMEPPLRDTRSLAESATDAFASILLERPRAFALYGHSLGATVAFEVARTLRRRRLPMPRALVLSGRCSPTRPYPRAPIAELPEPAFIAELEELAGTPPEILANKEMMDMLMPMLRADFHAAENHTHAVEPPLDVPFFVHGGTEDAEVPRDSLEAWQLETSSRFSLRMFPGNHFFIDGSREAVWAALSEDLTGLLGGNP